MNLRLITQLSSSTIGTKPGKFPGNSTYLLSLLCLIVLPALLHAQKFRVEQTEVHINESWVSTPFEMISDMGFIDSLRGFMLSGSYGIPLALTTDGGRTWKTKNELSGQGRDADLIMFSSDTLFYISVNKKIIYTYNGAQNWSIIDDARGITGDIASVVFYDRLRGVCTTTDGATRLTVDGGSNWTVLPNDSAGLNSRLKVYGNYTIGYGSGSGFMLSPDKGATWRKILFSDSISTPNFMKIMNGKVYISTASNRWYITGLDGQILQQEYLGTGPDVKRFAFPSENEIWAADRSQGVKISVPGSGIWVYSGFPEQRNVSGVYESFNGLVLVGIYDVDQGCAMMQQRNPGKLLSVRNGKLPGNLRLSAVKIINPGLTLVGSYDGIIFKSSDMGLTWESTTGNNIYPAITDITFKDASLIFAGCDGGSILKSTNGGSSWTLIKTNISEKITGIEYKRVDSLFITTESKVYTATISNPANLVPLNLNTSSSGQLYKVKFWDRNTGYIGATKSSFYTTNGGKSWTSYGSASLPRGDVSILPGVASYQISGSTKLRFHHQVLPLIFDADFRGIFELIDNDSTSGYIIDTYYGSIVPVYPLESRFEYLLAGGPRALNDFDYYNNDYSLGVGDAGELLFISRRSSQEPPSLCYGLTPNRNSTISGRDISLDWTEPNVLVPTGEYQVEIAKGDTSNIVISQTGIDSTWFRVTGLEEEKTYHWRVRGRNAFGWGEFTGWVTFFLGREIYAFNQYQLPVSATVNSITESSNGILFAVGNSGFIAKSFDFGISWQVLSVPFSDDLKYCTVNPFSNTVFVASATGDLLSSSDNGNSWQRTPAILTGSIIKAVTFPNATDGYLCGSNGLIARTSDGGATWLLSSIPVSSGHMNAIHAENEGVVLVASDNGKLFRSEDFGYYFDYIEIFTGDNYKALLKFNDKLIMLAESGSGLTTTDGGISWSELNLHLNGTPRVTDVSAGRFRILSFGNALFTSTKDGSALSYQLLPGTNSKNAIYLTLNGNLIVAGSGSNIFVGRDTSTVYTSLAGDETGSTPGSHQLFQNYPNPFNGSTVIPVYLKTETQVLVDLYNLLGEKVLSIYNGVLGEGNHLIPLDTSGKVSGVYLYRLNAGGTVITKKLVLLK